MRRGRLLFVAGLVALAVVGQAQAGFLKRGDLVVVDTARHRIVRVDPVTGDRTILSGAERGEGPTMLAPTSITQAPDGSLVVTDVIASRVLRIDPQTGDRTTISQQVLPEEYIVLGTDPAPVGTGPDFQEGELSSVYMGNVTLRSDGGLMVLAQYGLFHVDPISGDRTLISGETAGSGPLWSNPVFGMTQAANGDLYFAGYYDGSLYRVDPFTGERFIVSDADTGSGPPFLSGLLAPITAPDGSILLSNAEGGIQHLLRIDPLTGDREIVPGSEGIAGFAVAWLSDEELVLAAEPIGNNLRVFNLTTGDYWLLTGEGIGSGPEISWPYAMIVYVPEPTSITLVLVGLVAAAPLAARRLARRYQRATA